MLKSEEKRQSFDVPPLLPEGIFDIFGTCQRRGGGVPDTPGGGVWNETSPPPTSTLTSHASLGEGEA